MTTRQSLCGLTTLKNSRPRGGIESKLTVQDRILLHLLESGAEEDSAEVPRERTQSGLAEAAGIQVKHVPIYARPLMAKGNVVERSAHIEGGRQRRKTYFLTLSGRKEASRIHTALSDREVILESVGGRVTTTLREAMKDRLRGIPILTVLRSVGPDGVLRVPEPVPLRQRQTRVPRTPNLEQARRALARAREFERKHDWRAAEEVYREGLQLLPPSEVLLRADVLERVGRATFQGAFQAETLETFRARMQTALADYKAAREACDSRSGMSRGRNLRCEAMAAYASYWLSPDAAGKRAHATEVHRLTAEALRAFEAEGEALEYGRTFNELHFGAVQNHAYFGKREETRQLLDELTRWGEHAVELLESTGDRVELARACANTSVLLANWAAVNPSAHVAYHRKARECWRQATRLSEAEAYGAIRRGPSIWGFGTAEALAAYRKALERARQRDDALGMAYALDNLQFHTVHKALSLEDPEAKVGLLKEALRYALDAKRFYGILGHDRLYLQGFSMGHPLADYHATLAELEADPGKKRELLEQVLEAAPSLLKWAEASGALRVMASEHSVVAGALVALANLKVVPAEKRRLLEEALGHAQQCVEIAEPVETFTWNLGGFHDNLANILAALSDLVDDPPAALLSLRQAVAEKETCLRLMMEEQPYYESVGDPGGWVELGSRQYERGQLLVRLAERAWERKAREEAIQTFEEAVALYEKVGVASRIAECHWRIAQAHEALSDFSKAAEAFRRAAEAFNAAAERIPALRAHHQDHAFLMEAWSEIEEGRARHAQEDYGRAKDHYEKAAILHRASRRWAYLAPNYLAWARLEAAEDLSRREAIEEAIEALRDAARSFEETGRSLAEKRPSIEDPEEGQLVARLIRAAPRRAAYCQARTTLEQGRFLEGKGDPSGAAEKYRIAADRFEDLLQGLESEEDRRDVSIILTLSRASESMARAESGGSPADYHEASDLFDKAAALSSRQRSKDLAVGHGRLCRALEAEARFVQSRQADARNAAREGLEGAEDCFRRAGAERLAAHARARCLLMDAREYMDEAARKGAPEDKTRLYGVAAKILQSAATAFGQAGQERKRSDVTVLFRRIGEEREIAAALEGLLRAPAMAVSTSAFVTPPQTEESSTGLERIQSADLQVNLIVRRRTVRTTDSLQLAVELVNAGRAPAQLLRIENLVPKGFELVRAAAPHAFAGRHLNLKGRRLEPLKSEEVTLVLRPRGRGTFRLRPRVLYLDEGGNPKECRPIPVEITVASSVGPTGRRSKRDE